MGPLTKSKIDEMQNNANLIGGRLQDLIDKATLQNFTGHASNDASASPDDAACAAALEPLSMMLRMLSHPSSPTSAT